MYSACFIRIADEEVVSAGYRINGMDSGPDKFYSMLFLGPVVV